MVDQLTTRVDFKHFQSIPTRWEDNDSYGHVNNVVYYSYFDTLVTQHLIENAGLDPAHSQEIGLVVETKCTFLQEITFPEIIHAGLRVAKLGNSSVVYEIGLFKEDQEQPAATGHFVHVYVDRTTRKPIQVPEHIRAAIVPLQE